MLYPYKMEKDRKAYPLRGKRVIVTRALEQAGSLKRLLEERGASAVLFPTIAFRAVPVPHQILEKLEDYHWIIFTSANGVRFFMEELEKRKAPFPKHPKVAVIGPGTKKEAEERGIEVSLVPKRFIAEGLLEELRDVAGKRILIPRARVARSILPETLGKRGAFVDVVPVYETCLPSVSEGSLKDLELADAITFTSPSTVENFVRILGSKAFEICKRLVVASIGPVTTKRAEELGIDVDVTSEEHSLEGLVKSLEGFFG